MSRVSGPIERAICKDEGLAIGLPDIFPGSWDIVRDDSVDAGFVGLDCRAVSVLFSQHERWVVPLHGGDAIGVGVSIANELLLIIDHG